MSKRLTVICQVRGIALAFLASMLAWSCGGGGNAQPPSTGSPSISPATLTLNTNGLDFGSVSLGSSKATSITLMNSAQSGAASVTISKVNTTGSGFSETSAGVPFTLSPGQSSSITVSFAPTLAGTATGQLAITAQAGTQPISIPLSGNGLGPGQLAVSPTSMNFGDVIVGASQNQTGMLIAGSSDVSISSASFTSPEYSLSGISLPATVAAGTSVPFTVTFTPDVTASFPDQLLFLSDATNSPAVTLTGAGIQSAIHSVDLSWNASTSQVAGYNLYRSTQSNGPYTKLNSVLISGLTFTDTDVQSGTTYFYLSTSVDANSIESGYSNEATAAIP